MIDLVILLSISLAVTALLGLLLVGFVWVPWLIGLILLVLLVALMNVRISDDPQIAQLQEGSSVVQQGQEIGNHAAAPSEEQPVMVYRGVKYKRSESEGASTSATMTQGKSVTQGKYRGQQWSR